MLRACGPRRLDNSFVDSRYGQVRQQGGRVRPVEVAAPDSFTSCCHINPRHPPPRPPRGAAARAIHPSAPRRRTRRRSGRFRLTFDVSDCRRCVARRQRWRRRGPDQERRREG
eukprot:364893-Chlamydomonas_euryale.AAC.3